MSYKDFILVEDCIRKVLQGEQDEHKSDYGLFMANVTTYTTRAKVPHDDGIDSLAMMAEYVQNPLGGKATAMQNPFWGRR